MRTEVMWTDESLQFEAMRIRKNIRISGKQRALLYTINRAGKPVFVTVSPHKADDDPSVLVGVFTSKDTWRDIFEAMLVMVQEHGEAA